MNLAIEMHLKTFSCVWWYKDMDIRDIAMILLCSSCKHVEIHNTQIPLECHPSINSLGIITYTAWKPTCDSCHFLIKQAISIDTRLLVPKHYVYVLWIESDKPCAVSVAVQSRQNGKVVAYFTIELLSLADYLFKKVFFPFQAISKCI